MPDIISLADLGIEEDPGTAWHPRPDKTEARDADGNLIDLDDATVQIHTLKPEAASLPDAASFEPLSAEDSFFSPDGEV